MTSAHNFPMHDPASPRRPDFLVTLGVLLPCNEDDVKQAFLAKVKTAHPDVGGDVKEFMALQEAFERATEYARFTASRTRWLSASIERYAAQEQLVTDVRRLGGRVDIEHIDWLKQEIGDDFAQILERLIGVHLSGPSIGDEAINTLVRHPEICVGLRVLDVADSRVTDSGLSRLQVFRGLRELDLTGTPTTVAGLSVLSHLVSLERLGLHGTEVSWNQRRQIHRAHPNLEIVTAGRL